MGFVLPLLKGGQIKVLRNSVLIVLEMQYVGFVLLYFAQHFQLIVFLLSALHIFLVRLTSFTLSKFCFIIIALCFIL